jgi:biotin carboxylase
VLTAGHKYYSRVAQRAAVPQAVPGFALFDPREPGLQAPLSFPFFAKPVKGSYSLLARRIEDRAAFDAFVSSPAVLEFGQTYLAIFNRLVEAYTSFEADGHWFIAEGLIAGDMVTVEGYAWDGAVEVFGIVDSTLHPNRSFARFDYPSLLPEDVQARMADIARRVIARLGLERCLWNIEMMHDPASGRIWIVEVNPRICGQFADLYQKVDGTNTYEIALALALGERPQRAKGEGQFDAAASFPLRIFASMLVREAPSSGDVAAAEELFPETLVWSEAAAGQTLAVNALEEDGGSHRYAVINVGGENRKEVQSRCDVVHARLGYRMEPQPAAAPAR